MMTEKDYTHIELIIKKANSIDISTALLKQYCSYFLDNEKITELEAYQKSFIHLKKERI